jgi:hypothetical protein
MPLEHGLGGATLRDLSYSGTAIEIAEADRDLLLLEEMAESEMIR